MSTGQNDASYVADIAAIRKLVSAYPERSRHVLDLPYRLASHAAQDAANRRIQRDGDGRVVAYAFTQLPMWTLDYLVSDDEAGELERGILDWGIARWREARAQGGPPMMFVDVRDDDTRWQAVLAERGFTRHEWYQLHLSQERDTPLPPAAPPPGVTIRPLAGDLEVAGYVALHRAAFGTENMTERWRHQVLGMSEYRPELDLVAVAPDGRLAGFCVGWLGAVDGRIEGQVEPMGVHPDFQGHGLGHALLTGCLRRLQAAGAGRLHIEVDGTNDAARTLYAAVGFRTAATYLKYGLRV